MKKRGVLNNNNDHPPVIQHSYGELMNIEEHCPSIDDHRLYTRQKNDIHIAILNYQWAQLVLKQQVICHSIFNNPFPSFSNMFF